MGTVRLLLFLFMAGYVVSASAWGAIATSTLTDNHTKLEILWERAYGGPEDDGASAIIQSGSREFLVVGFTESMGAGEGDVYILKIDSDGNRIWERTYGSSLDDGANDIISTGDGAFLVVGFAESLGGGMTMSTF